jgi:hypothetical protein
MRPPVESSAPRGPLQKAENYVSIIGTDEAMPAKPLFVLAESRVPPFDLAVSRPRYNGRVAASTKKPK